MAKITVELMKSLKRTEIALAVSENLGVSRSSSRCHHFAEAIQAGRRVYRRANAFAASTYRGASARGAVAPPTPLSLRV